MLGSLEASNLGLLPKNECSVLARSIFEGAEGRSLLRAWNMDYLLPCLRIEKKRSLQIGKRSSRFILMGASRSPLRSWRFCCISRSFRNLASRLLSVAFVPGEIAILKKKVVHFLRNYRCHTTLTFSDGAEGGTCSCWETFVFASPRKFLFRETLGTRNIFWNAALVGQRN